MLTATDFLAIMLTYNLSFAALELEAMLRQRRTDQVIQLLLISHDFAAVHESLVGTFETWR